MNITTIGLDIAKQVFHVVGCDKQGKQLKKKKLRRRDIRVYFTQLPPCLVGLEASGSAHYWGRELHAMGHDVRLLPPQYVKPYVQGNKTDYNDALAIAEAVVRPEKRFVAIKTTAQQDRQALHRLRQGLIKERTALSNRLRGLLSEYGIVIPPGIATLRKRIPDLLEIADNGLSETFRRLLRQSYTQFVALDEQIDWHEVELKSQVKQDDACQRLQTIPGYGPMVSSAFASVMGDGRQFAKGRDAAASVGLVPRQHSSGDKPLLLGISKRGDKYLRALLVHGARAVVRQAKHKDDPLSQWLNRLVERRGLNKACVAMANKMVRMGWAVLSRHEVYRAGTLPRDATL